jgi:type II secretory pathway component GspD/PulD (secretin)
MDKLSRRTKCTVALAVAVCLLTAASLFAGERSDLGFLNNRIYLTLDKSPVADVVRLLAKQNGFNVTIAGEIEGEVSMSLSDVPLAEALDAILLPNKCSWYIKQNIMVVKPSDYLAEDERITIVARLRYVTGQQASQATTHLLSTGGKIEVLVDPDVPANKKTSPTMIVISDRKSVVDQALRVIQELDKPEPQLNIEVKLVETNLTVDDKLGINWPESYSMLFGGVASGSGEVAALGTHALDGGKWVWGTFSASTVQTALDVLLKSGNSKLLSNPNLTTISNKPAEIAITTTIPVQTLNRFTEGAVIQDIVSFQNLDVGITLIVTGRVNDSGFITLAVNPTIEEITGMRGPMDNQRPITAKRSMNTNVRVKDGETLVMGGLLRETTVRTVKRLPGLGSIPILGRLFQHHDTHKEKTDLTVFITPKVVSP